ncbi:MAG: flagellar biosynthetic protein FliR [Pseudomonadota bacterium]
MHLTETQLLGWLGLYFWPFVRIAAALMAAPLFGSRALPMRLRLVFALLLTVVMAPLLPATPPLAFFTAEALAMLLRELLLGLVLGLALQLVFEAMALAGELLSSSMGLSFAQMSDPLRGVSSTVLASFLQALAVLSFLALGGHLALVEWLRESFAIQPIGSAPISTATLLPLVLEGSQLFAGALRVALPGVCALLLVNLAFGVMNRAAPALNMMSVGFPISLTAGLVILALSLGSIQTVFAEMLMSLGTRLPSLLGVIR